MWILDLIALLIPIALLVVAYVAGRWCERRHFVSIREREAQHRTVPVATCKTFIDERPVATCDLAVGSVVVSVDHFKRFLMAWRLIFGGEVRSYASLIDRGRREAILRMRESQPQADLFLNCRLETSAISNGKGKTVGTVEVIAYGTAIRYA